MAPKYITDEMSAAVGKSYGRMVSFPVTESDIRRWAIAVYYPATPPREFWDPTFWAASRFGRQVAPHEFNPFAWVTAEPLAPRPPIDLAAINANELALGIAPPPLVTGLNGGMEVEYFERIHPGDVITSMTTLRSYTEKESRMGTMLITTIDETWTNQDDAAVKRLSTTSLRY